MKEAKKGKGLIDKMLEGTTFTINEELSKYSGPEFEPPKLKKIREKFKGPIIIHR
jgi:hypothetical protein